MSTTNDISLTTMNHKNIILYGPPGTGKTYYTTAYALAIIEKKPIYTIIRELKEHSDSVFRRYKQYREEGKIEFITFHQSFGYEEFIEGIQPELTSDDDSNKELLYKLKDGIFKSFCKKADTPYVQGILNYGIRPEPVIWKASLLRARENLVRRDCFDHNRVRIGLDYYGKDITDETNYEYGGSAILSRFIDEMTIGDIILTLFDEETIDGVGIVTGEYEWLEDVIDHKRSRNVSWLVKDIRENIRVINGGIAMTVTCLYRLNRISLSDIIDIVKKHNPYFGTVKKKNTSPYVFLIDEINRGNLSKIFGELITLLEPSKRIGQKEEILVKLPYSGEIFGIPDNIYIIGTMNTADRSIALMDTALRRRFRFIEMQPDPSVLNNIIIDNIQIERLLTTINQRITLLFDREHTIGHAYFLSLSDNPTINNLAEIFQTSIIPLLQEYFFDDYEKISGILGDTNHAVPSEQFFIELPMAVSDPFFLLFEQEANTIYKLNSSAFFNPNSYIKIYQSMANQ